MRPPLIHTVLTNGSTACQQRPEKHAPQSSLRAPAIVRSGTTPPFHRDRYKSPLSSSYSSLPDPLSCRTRVFDACNKH
uniref:Uncharacterized protein n=1 Tax=Caenorhabditis japonica TaxID=281687 RepID=A0A8R1I953_CAEJA